MELLPPPSEGEGGSLRISFEMGGGGGLYTAFARAGGHTELRQRVRCLAFMPEKIIPIMDSKLRVVSEQPALGMH